MNSLRVFVTGATGLIGRALCDALARDGHDVIALSRAAQPATREGRVRFVRGDPAREGDWQRELAGADAVVHLAGESLARRRWTRSQKARLVASRVESTQRIVEGLGASAVAASVLVCASAVGIYGPRGEEELDEDSAPGGDFLADLCREWESAARGAEGCGVRGVQVRFGPVLSAGGGALAQLLPLYRLGLGGPLGPGDRWFPWIHEDDAVGIVRFALEQPLRGAVNAVSPGCVRMREFAAALGGALGRPAWLPVPLPVLRIALGEVASALSPGQRVIPRRALDAGYAFRHPTLEGALEACLG